MACTITIGIDGNLSEFLPAVKLKIEEQGGTFDGDDKNGNFNIPVLGSDITGDYTITGQDLNLNITHKPFLISCNQIKKRLESMKAHISSTD